ncbi:hypothetical protein KAR91_29175 [Candidatus Pacearchaeota archaeon]|nr:hypothetical protein [Candidatus Pacearchaeota archaeon]
MRITKTGSYQRLAEKQTNKDFISSILDEIFIICREDKHFSDVRKKAAEVDLALNEIRKKVSKQDSLLEKSSSLKNDVAMKIKILDNSCLQMRSELLEQLGSEL